MSADPHYPETRTQPGLAPAGLPDGAADIAADLEEDRRVLQELDEAELGGEA